jgi:hypothetical protein
VNDAPLYLHLLVMSFAAARLAVLLVHDTILDRPRDWLHRHRPPFDNPLLGFDYQQRDVRGDRMPEGTVRDPSLLGELFTCTRCMSVWTASTVALVYASDIPYAREAVAVVAVMGLASILSKKV